MRLVLAGEREVPPLLLADAAPAPAALTGLTPRQPEALGLVCQGVPVGLGVSAAIGQGALPVDVGVSATHAWKLWSSR